MIHLLGVKNGQAVATGSVFLTDVGAYIYNIATIESERQRGYGSQITWALLNLAKKRGQTRAGLISSPMAASTYRKLGFEDICRFRVLA